jgi:histidinol-phosphate aminotransferase
MRALDLALTAIGFPCSPSQANFLLATVPAGGRWHSAEKIYQFLVARRIFVRWFDEEGLRDKLRISIGTPEENQHLVEALRLLGGSNSISKRSEPLWWETQERGAYQ